MFIGKKTNQDKFFLKIQAKQTAKKWLTDAVSGFKLTVCILSNVFKKSWEKSKGFPDHLVVWKNVCIQWIIKSQFS